MLTVGLGLVPAVGHCCSSWEEVEARVRAVQVRLNPESPGEGDSRERELVSSWFE